MNWASATQLCAHKIPVSYTRQSLRSAKAARGAIIKPTTWPASRSAICFISPASPANRRCSRPAKSPMALHRPTAPSVSQSRFIIVSTVAKDNISTYRCTSAPVTSPDILFQLRLHGEKPARASRKGEETDLYDPYATKNGYARIFIIPVEQWRRLVDWMEVRRRFPARSSRKCLTAASIRTSYQNDSRVLRKAHE